MGSLQILRIHVASVGFVIDRIVLPAINMKADRVWLTVHSGSEVDKGDEFVKAIQWKLSDGRIECLQASADRIDLFDISKALRTIILKEKGNSILVNVSVGSKIQAIASMMACMLLDDDTKKFLGWLLHNLANSTRKLASWTYQQMHGW